MHRFNGEIVNLYPSRYKQERRVNWLKLMWVVLGVFGALVVAQTIYTYITVAVYFLNLV